MNKNVQGLERNTYRFERNLRFSEKKRLVGQSFSKSGKVDKDSPIYRLPKEESGSRSAGNSDRVGCSIGWQDASRSAGLFDQDASGLISNPFRVFHDGFRYFDFDKR